MHSDFSLNHSRRGTLLNAMKRFLSLQPMIPPKCIETPPPLTGGCSEGLDAFRFFFKRVGDVKILTYLVYLYS